MPDWLNPFLLVLFAAHLLAFGRLAILRRQAYHTVASVTFTLLVAVFALRIWAPGWQVAGVPVHGALRVAAWASAAVSLSLLLHRRWRRRR